MTSTQKIIITKGDIKHFTYIELRLSLLDETDVGLYPDKVELECKITVDGKTEIIKEKFLEYIVSRWAHIANQGPCIIHFEELNRAQLSVRNAALQILLEREIGYNFKFNNDVFMVATGNLGEEDGTDVEEFDAALNSRLIHYRHSLTMDQWFEYYAKENVHESILTYLENHPSHYYVGKKSRKDTDKAFACPRTWTFLSDYITKNYGKNANIIEWLEDVRNVGHSYIGSTFTSFLRYLDDAIKININDIINKYPQLKLEKIIINRSKESELLSELKSIEIPTLNDFQLENVKAFLSDLGNDECTSFLLHLIDKHYTYIEDANMDIQENKFIIEFLKDERFYKYQDTLSNYIAKEDVEEKKIDEENTETPEEKNIF